MVDIVNITDWNDTLVECYKIRQIPTSPPLVGQELWANQYMTVSGQQTIAEDFYMLFNMSGMYSEVYNFEYFNESLMPEFPLSLATTWNQTIIQNATGYSCTWMGVWLNITWDRSNATQIIGWSAGEVLNISNVTVAAGTFETWCINITTAWGGDPASLIQYWSPTVKNIVLMTNSTSGEFLFELVSYGVEADLTLVMTLLLLSHQQSSQAATTTYMYAGVGLGAIGLLALGIALWRRRG